MIQEHINCPWCGHTHGYDNERYLEEDLGDHICAMCGQVFVLYRMKRYIRVIRKRSCTYLDYWYYQTKRKGKLKKGGYR